MPHLHDSNLLAHVLDAVVVTDAAFRIVGWNRASSALYGWASGEVLGKVVGEVIGTEYIGISGDEFVVRFLAEGRWQGEVTQFTRCGEQLHVHASVSKLTDGYGEMVGAVAINRDIRDLKRALPAEDAVNQELKRLAFYDALTGLPNRRMLDEHIAKVAAQRRGDDARLSLACLDLDGFKEVNDSYGHLAGDRVLEQVAQRLRRVLREGDLVARVGGDEFVVVLEGGDDHQVAGALERLEAALTAPYTVDGEEIHVGVSIGVSSSDRPDTALTQLLSEADRAMYGVKERGGGIAFAADDSRGPGWGRMHFANDLRRALDGEQLSCYYQPIVDLERHETIAHEALLRWQHPTRGLVLPDIFLAVADRSAQIEEIDRWVVRKSFLEARRRGMNVAVNVSARTLTRAEFVDFVAAELRANRLGPGRVQIEIAEKAFATPGAILANLGALRKLGVRIALDDFGTGPTHLLTIGSLPIDVLKLDLRFVQGLGRRLEARAVCGFMTQLAHDLGLVAVAEGVESEAQLELFRAAGGDQAQGALFRLPEPLPPLAGFLGGGGIVPAAASGHHRLA